uniref:Cap-specific mRNA (nucleoside-2'-O-)-methyltransferase n=1 Tax=Mimivirus LCMiAC01 TaxID=2506608 RepID=A0A481Z362_9VIRU|nr:MAG: poly a polymerase regulatory subunit [Mimivirus LCMiAC01]
MTNKRYLCTIDAKLYNTLKHNPHTIQFFCGVKNIYADSQKEYNEAFHDDKTLLYYYKRDRVPHALKKELLVNKPPYKNNKLPRKLEDIHTSIKYKGRQQIPETVLHWGQLKLLMGEMDFFNRYLNPKKKYTIVYAGAARGDHVILSLELYKNLNFVLVDPAKFNKDLYNKKRVRIINDYFTNDLARKLKKEYDNIIYISDIRTSTKEEDVKENHKMQKKWYEIMNPDYTLLKFRLPWDQDTFDYLDGEIYLQSFPPRTSTETRLVVKKSAKIKTYDSKEYENKLFYYNLYDRARYYDHNYKVDDLYMDHCCDCTSTLNIIDDYLKSDFNEAFKSFSVEKLMKRIINLLAKYRKRGDILKIHYLELINKLSIRGSKHDSKFLIKSHSFDLYEHKYHKYKQKYLRLKYIHENLYKKKYLGGEASRLIKISNDVTKKEIV